jgi:hypothetical protein
MNCAAMRFANYIGAFWRSFVAYIELTQPLDNRLTLSQLGLCPRHSAIFRS